VTGDSWDLPDVDRFTAGTVGPAGQRVFYLQAVAGAEVVTLRLEKQQVAAMAQYLAELLADLPPPAEGEVPDDLDLVEPVEEAWIVGELGVVFDEARDRMVVRAHEIEIVDEDGEPESGGGSLQLVLTIPQVHGFVFRAAQLVTAGRPTCALCGRSVDPEGHTCLKTNGHKPR
jgi:uncharacterized repeat protein (TIGR03847 family)